MEANQTTLEQTGVIRDLDKIISVENSPKSALWATFELDIIIFLRWP